MPAPSGCSRPQHHRPPMLSVWKFLLPPQGCGPGGQRLCGGQRERLTPSAPWRGGASALPWKHLSPPQVRKGVTPPTPGRAWPVRASLWPQSGSSLDPRLTPHTQGSSPAPFLEKNSLPFSREGELTGGLSAWGSHAEGAGLWRQERSREMATPGRRDANLKFLGCFQFHEPIHCFY